MLRVPVVVLPFDDVENDVTDDVDYEKSPIFSRG